MASSDVFTEPSVIGDKVPGKLGDTFGFPIVLTMLSSLARYSFNCSSILAILALERSNAFFRSLNDTSDRLSSSPSIMTFTFVGSLVGGVGVDAVLDDSALALLVSIITAVSTSAHILPQTTHQTNAKVPIAKHNSLYRQTPFLHYLSLLTHCHIPLSIHCFISPLRCFTSLLRCFMPPLRCVAPSPLRATHMRLHLRCSLPFYAATPLRSSISITRHSHAPSSHLFVTLSVIHLYLRYSFPLRASVAPLSPLFVSSVFPSFVSPFKFHILTNVFLLMTHAPLHIRLGDAYVRGCASSQEGLGSSRFESAIPHHVRPIQGLYRKSGYDSKIPRYNLTYGSAGE